MLRKRLESMLIEVDYAHGRLQLRVSLVNEKLILQLFDASSNKFLGEMERDRITSLRDEIFRLLTDIKNNTAVEESVKMTTRPFYCYLCRVENPSSVIINDNLWNSTGDDVQKEVLCYECIQNRIGRQLQISDLKECGITRTMMLGVQIFKQSEVK